ncbi:hypothetical protein CO038_01455 [Candidatus Pacearchaeota archaeon CG_4_9_14_0_2_um_filter_39_13]|nr:hypothetical protein [Candidatus Pacearchaeota archaeon]OIO43780.1 MAG: hypothetical protein AUJ64_01710 [Candidatus Pacearchaeota archaeon CG1_02_39_14]PJC44875.1 MAG: hypothetical protein CO038_01455 [Candidatus Pacearchaeota archaeon CG_4_9_14_0_2_um_filter_39_13]
MVRKKFFRERTPTQIRKLDIRPASTAKGLVDRIFELGPTEALLIRAQIIPGRFYSGNASSAEAARKAYKHGHYINLPQARSLQDAMEETRLPHEIRAEAFANHLEGESESEIQSVGYAFRPVQGRDRTKRLVPFAWLMEGARIFTYAVQSAGGIDVKPYPDAERVETEGANIVVSVPSRTEKKERYQSRLHSVPVIDNRAKHAISLGFNSTYSEGKVPEHSLWSFGYKFKGDQEESHSLITYPHDVAGMLGVSAHFMVKMQNKVPWDMNQFAKPSQLAADFYRKLRNNVLITDPSIEGKDKNRKLYVPEVSIMLARLIGRVGTEESMFWMAGRDPRPDSYDWSIPGED